MVIADDRVGCDGAADFLREIRNDTNAFDLYKKSIDQLCRQVYNQRVCAHTTRDVIRWLLELIHLKLYSCIFLHIFENQR